MTTAVQTDILSDIRDGQNLFSLPVTMYEILEALADERAGVERLAHAINRDPALTTTVLRVSNSPYYHRVSEVRNLSEAVMTIGDLSVRTIALTATILNPKHIERLSGIDPVEFVANSIAVATIAHTLAQEVGYHKPQNALTAGLIHDLGVLYFMSRHTERYREVVRACADGRNLLDVETEVFGVNHTEAGAEIARAWRLPEELITTIKAHHSGGETDVDDGLGLIVQLAVLSAGDVYVNYQRDLKRDLLATTQLQRRLNLSDERLHDCVERALAESAQLAVRFGVDIGSLESLLTRANRKLGHYLEGLERLMLERDQSTTAKLAAESARAAAESRITAVTQLSHHINNAAAVILGRAETLDAALNRLVPDAARSQVNAELNEIRTSVNRIKSTLAEMSQVQTVDELTQRAGDIHTRTPRGGSNSDRS